MRRGTRLPSSVRLVVSPGRERPENSRYQTGIRAAFPQVGDPSLGHPPASNGVPCLEEDPIDGIDGAQGEALPVSDGYQRTPNDGQTKGVPSPRHPS